MLIHPWDAATGPAAWQDWLASTGRFGILAVNNLDPARAPLILPTHFTLALTPRPRGPCLPSGPLLATSPAT